MTPSSIITNCLTLVLVKMLKFAYKMTFSCTRCVYPLQFTKQNLDTVLWRCRILSAIRTVDSPVGIGGVQWDTWIVPVDIIKSSARSASSIDPETMFRNIYGRQRRTCVSRAETWHYMRSEKLKDSYYFQGRLNWARIMRTEWWQTIIGSYFRSGSGLEFCKYKLQTL